jgi:hypothetical protein
LPSPLSRARPPFVDDVVRALDDRLTELDEERTRIVAALRALDGESSGRSRPTTTKRRTLNSRIIKMIDAHPGIRTSMLALGVSESADVIRSALAHLERDGHIRKERLGWARAGE